MGRLTRQLLAALFARDPNTTYRLLYAPASHTDLSALPRRANVGVRRAPLPERWQTVAWHRLHLPLWADSLLGGVDVFHSPDFVLAPVRQARTLLTIHDLSFAIVPECAEPSLRRYLDRAVPRSVHTADRIAADSQATADDLQRLYGVPSAKIEVLYSAADARFRPLALDDAEAALAGLAVPRPFILTVGTLEPRKNLPRLIDAFHTLEIPHHLVVVGARGWLDTEIGARLRSPHVLPLGYVTDDQLVALYKLADFCVCPSLYEGFGLPAVEAMACGTPVAVADTSSLREVVGSAGLMFDPLKVGEIAMAMHRLATEPALRSDLGQAGLEQSRRFSWDRSAAQLQALYLELAG
ncbi:MAG: glycosyltransferase family 4 protein [Chloroflexota bacterium]